MIWPAPGLCRRRPARAGTRWRTRPCKSRWLRGHATSGAVTPSQPRPVHCYGLEGASGAPAQAQAAAETRSQEVASERSETPKINLAKLQTPSHDGSDEKTYRTPSFPVSNPRGFIDATTCPGSVLRCRFINNPEPRCPCVLLLDTSSMSGSRIDQLNAGLKQFQKELAADPMAYVGKTRCTKSLDAAYVHVLTTKR